MYNTMLVKRRKKRIVAWLTFATTSIAISSLIIVSYLGENLGSYTIEVKGEDRSLSMATSVDFATPTTLLRADGVEPYPYKADSLPADSSIDNNTLSGSHNGARYNNEGEVLDYYFFAYTFYVKNSGTVNTDYSLQINLEDTQSSTNGGVNLIEIVRIRLYENLVSNDGSETHNKETYAKRTNQVINDGNEIRECISQSSDGKSSVCTGVNNTRAQAFYEDSYKSLVKRTYTGLAIDSIVRYTVVIWLEGYDPDCQGVTPENASIAFSMSFETQTSSVSE